MTEREFSKFCNELAADPPDLLKNLASGDWRQIHFLHGAIGIATEAGELLDVAKKALVYQKPPDVTNVKEEIGDVLHYLSYVCSVFGFTFIDCMEANVRKLRERYPQGFSTERAVERDTNRERTALAGDHLGAVEK